MEQYFEGTSQFPNLEFIFNSSVNINKLIILTTFPFIQNLSDLAISDACETGCYATCTIVISSLAELSNHLCENIYIYTHIHIYICTVVEPGIFARGAKLIIIKLYCLTLNYIKLYPTFFHSSKLVIINFFSDLSCY